MELKERFYILRKRAWLIILITLIATFTISILNFYVIKPKYKADTSVIIGKESRTNNSGTDYYDVMMYQTMVKTYSKLARSRTIAEDVIDKLKLQSLNATDLISMIEVTPDKDTQFLTIIVTSNNAKEAMDIANQFAISLKNISLTVYNVDSVKLLEKAQLPTNPDSPKKNRNIAMTFFIAVIFSIGLAFFLEYLDNTVKTKEDVEEIPGLHVIGTVSLIKIKDKDVVLC
jgi:capsular polysaccharide biosynthesis protein